MKIQTPVGDVVVRWRKRYHSPKKNGQRIFTECELQFWDKDDGFSPCYYGFARKHPKDKHHAGIGQYLSLSRAVEYMVEELWVFGKGHDEIWESVGNIVEAFWEYAAKCWPRWSGDSTTLVPIMEQVYDQLKELFPKEEAASTDTPDTPPPAPRKATSTLRDDEKALLEVYNRMSSERKLDFHRNVYVMLHHDGSGSFYRCGVSVREGHLTNFTLDRTSWWENHNLTINEAYDEAIAILRERGLR